MLQSQSSDKSHLPPYIYGTTRLGDNKIPFDNRVWLARTAIEGVSWFFTVAQNIQPQPAEISDEITKLHDRW